MVAHHRAHAGKRYAIEYVYDGHRRLDNCMSKLEVTDFVRQLLTVNGRVSRITVYKWGDPIHNWERGVTLALYCKIHDAFLNPHRDEWLEEPCDDPTCDFCPGRPSRPSECAHAFEHESLGPPTGWS